MQTLNELFDKIMEQINNNISIVKCMNILKEYQGTDWKEYIKFCKLKYQRNLVKKNDVIEMLILCWHTGQESKIHDHPENGCIVKVLQGELEEECYAKTDKEFKLTSVNKLQENDVSYQKGETGLHNIKNNSTKIHAITLHIYSPPNYCPKFYV